MSGIFLHREWVESAWHGGGKTTRLGARRESAREMRKKLPRKEKKRNREREEWIRNFSRLENLAQAGGEVEWGVVITQLSTYSSCCFSLELRRNFALKKSITFHTKPIVSRNQQQQKICCKEIPKFKFSLDSPCIWKQCFSYSMFCWNV